MTLSMARKHGKAKSEAQYDGFDPRFEWQDNAGNFVLRIDLPEKKVSKRENFWVEVDDAGRLTVRVQRPAGDGNCVRFVKAFQLPPTSDLDGISCRFEANALSLTVPKLPSPQLPAELRPREGVAMAIKRNKEVIAVAAASAVAAFSLGLIVSKKLFATN